VDVGDERGVQRGVRRRSEPGGVGDGRGSCRICLGGSVVRGGAGVSDEAGERREGGRRGRERGGRGLREEQVCVIEEFQYLCRTSKLQLFEVGS
jgi:hypothetical protein